MNTKCSGRGYSYTERLNYSPLKLNTTLKRPSKDYPSWQKVWDHFSKDKTIRLMTWLSFEWRIDFTDNTSIFFHVQELEDI